MAGGFMFRMFRALLALNRLKPWSKTTACGFADSRWYVISIATARLRQSKARRSYEHDHVWLVLPKMRQVWLELPYLLQVWYILAILAASLVNRAQLAASLAALFWQYQLGNTKAIKELQSSRSTGQSPIQKKARDICLWPWTFGGE